MRKKRSQGFMERERAKSILAGFWLGALLFMSHAVVILFSGCLGPALVRETGYVPGVYEGSGRGYRGSVHVRLQVSLAGIEDIAITGHEDSAYPGSAAMEELLETVIETGSTDLDAVSGATFSSRGFLEAVEDALEQARTQPGGQARKRPPRT